MKITDIKLNNIPTYADSVSVILLTDEENIISFEGGSDNALTKTTSKWQTVDNDYFTQIRVQAIPRRQGQITVLTYANSQLNMAELAESMTIKLVDNRLIECEALSVNVEPIGSFVKYTIDISVIDVDGDNVVNYVKHDYVKKAYNVNRLQKFELLPENVFYSHSFEKSPDLETLNPYKITTPNTMQRNRANDNVSVYLPKNSMTAFIFDRSGEYVVNVESTNKNNGFDLHPLIPVVEHSDSYEFTFGGYEPYFPVIFSSNLQIYTENKRGVGESEYQYKLEFYTKILPKIEAPEATKDTVISDGVTYNDSVTQYNEAHFRLYLSELDYVMLSNYLNRVQKWDTVTFGNYKAVNEVRLETEEATELVDLVQIDVYVPFSISTI